MQCSTCNNSAGALKNDKAAMHSLEFWGEKAGWDVHDTYLGYNGGYAGFNGKSPAANANASIFDDIYDSIK